jgi:hypothetical protein
VGKPTTGWATKVKCTVGGIDLSNTFEKLEWKATVNNGYAVKARILDPYFNLLKKVTDEVYLKKARKEPVEVIFNLQWVSDAEKKKTEDRTAYMINLYSAGSGENGRLEFIAIDPPTWLLSRGKADGKYYEGSASDVIKKVCQENGVNEVNVSNTIDNKNGSWWMMRQDPKTFILSILEWSSSVVPNKTKWIVTPKDKELFIKEEKDLQSKDLGLIRVSTKNSEIADAVGFELLMDNFSHAMYSEEHTASLSSVSGYFIDKTTEPDKAVVSDKNTGNKANTNFGGDRGFDVTDKKFSTFKMAIPEDSAGGVGVKYQDYVSGTARNEFLNMLGFIMKIMVRINGDPVFEDPQQLGVSTVTLQWVGIDGEPYFLAGHWMVNGFHHTITPKTWHTGLYLNRLDYNATARKVGPNTNGA